MLKSSGSRHSMSRTCGPRDMISLVIPRIGDNRNQPLAHTSANFGKSLNANPNSVCCLLTLWISKGENPRVSTLVTLSLSILQPTMHFIINIQSITFLSSPAFQLYKHSSLSSNIQKYIINLGTQNQGITIYLFCFYPTHQ
jgi:hypothetical protein